MAFADEGISATSVQWKVQGGSPEGTLAACRSATGQGRNPSCSPPVQPARRQRPSRMPFVTLVGDGKTPSAIPAPNRVHHNFIVANYGADGAGPGGGTAGSPQMHGLAVSPCPGSPPPSFASDPPSFAPHWQAAAWTTTTAPAGTTSTKTFASMVRCGHNSAPMGLPRPHPLQVATSPTLTATRSTPTATCMSTRQSVRCMAPGCSAAAVATHCDPLSPPRCRRAALHAHLRAAAPGARLPRGVRQQHVHPRSRGAAGEGGRIPKV